MFFYNPVHCEKWTGVKEIEMFNKKIYESECFKATGRGVVISDIVRFYPTGAFFIYTRLRAGLVVCLLRRVGSGASSTRC